MVIYTPKRTNGIIELESYIDNLSEIICGYKDNLIENIPLNEIYCFCINDGNIYSVSKINADNIYENYCNCSEPSSKTLCVSSLWSIRQINFIKQAFLCKYKSPFYKICLDLNNRHIGGKIYVRNY